MNETKDLATAVGSLPREISPRRDLWPEIATRLGAQESVHSGTGRWRGQALAASVAIAFVAGLLMGRQWQEEVPVTTAVDTGGLAMHAAIVASEREYQAAFREFMPVATTTSLLEPSALSGIEASWNELNDAETALIAALAEYPDNHYLNQKLLDLRSQQLEFMKQLATLDQFSRRTT